MEPWLVLAARKHPDRVAVEVPERALSYSELLSEASGAASALDELAGASAKRIALALPAGEEFMVALHACLLSGRAVVPIDLRLSGAERAQREAAADWVIEGPLPRGRRSPAERPAAPETRAVPPETPVAVMHTSGTTAAPKPVVLSRANFEASALGSAVALGLFPEERWLCPMPLTHVGGLSIPIRSVFYASTAILPGGFDTRAVLDQLTDSERAVTLVSLVPTMLARLLDAGLEHPPTLRWALLGGGPIPPALLERAAAAGVPVAPTYGMTEACSQIATFGWPLPGVELRLREPDQEILVRGAIVAEGARSEDGWLHTGDLGAFDERGRLEIVGRKADTIVTGGENVAPAEVEAVLSGHPAVADAAVIGRADPEWGEALVALVVGRHGVSLDAEELRSYCRRRLAAFKVPKRVELVDQLPRTASGKLLRRELR